MKYTFLKEFAGEDKKNDIKMAKTTRVYYASRQTSAGWSETRAENFSTLLIEPFPLLLLLLVVL